MWALVDGFPGYSVSTEGEVRHNANLRPLKVQVNQFGVPYVCMVRDYEQLKRSLPRIVANAFIPRALEAFDTPINLDGDRLNCNVDNIMWRPRWFAIRYVQQFKDPYRNAINHPVKAVESSEVYPTSLDAAIRYGLLERDLVLSILNNTVVWPTYQRFEIVE